jgi:hypothetical protein
MKKLILILLVLFACTAIQAQSNSFFQPVSSNLFKKDLNAVKAVKTDVWLIRPAIALTAVQLNWNKTTKQFDASAFNQAGIGAGYQHFVELADGTAYNNYGFNAILLLGATQSEPSMSVALTGSFFNYVNVGGLYNFTLKSFGILTGVQLKF